MEDLFLKIKNELFSNNSIKEFCDKNKLSDKDIKKHCGKLYRQLENNKKCNECLGKKRCLMDEYHMSSYLLYQDGEVKIRFQNCVYDDFNKDSLVLMNFPKAIELLEEEVIFTKTRSKVLNSIGVFLEKYKKNEFHKGIYLHGSYGSGKTFLLLKLAKELTKRDYKVIFAYYPDLVRFLKSTISSNTLEEEINKLKNVDILMLDDVGAESNSSFVRDDILGPILQYRVFANLPVFMTSNLNIDLLADHLSEEKEIYNKINSLRIIERIKYLMEEITLEDKDYRK